MCIRDRAWLPLVGLALFIVIWLWKNGRRFGPVMPVELSDCLLYTSDAADERSSVDLGGRRIIKKKKNSKHQGVSTVK